MTVHISDRIPDSPPVKIIVKLGLPIIHYQVATGLANIHDYKCCRAYELNINVKVLKDGEWEEDSSSEKSGSPGSDRPDLGNVD
jgi:hypothetical protein